MPGKNPGHPELSVPENGEPAFFSGTDLRVLGTETQRRRQATMARLEGTGKDPLGRYGEGEMFDVPSTDPLYDELVEKGYAEVIDAKDDPARSPTQIADAVVSGQSLTDPVDQEVAKDLQGRELDVVQTGDPEAEAGDAGLDPDERSPVDPRRVTPAQVNATTQASSDPTGAAEAQAEADKEAKKIADADAKAQAKAEKAEEHQE